MKFRGPATVSVALHAMIIALAVVHLGWTSPMTSWGRDGTGGATTLILAPGIPLPPSPVENKLATDTPTLNLPEKPLKPQEREVEPPSKSKAFEMEDKTKRRKEWEDRIKKNMLAELAKNLPKAAPNAIPGSGGRAGAADLYKPAANIGSGGIGFGGDFGSRFGWYVDMVRLCLGQSWDRLRAENGARADARVQVAFEIQRNGTIANERVTVTSNIPATDRLGLSAVQACSGRSEVGSERHLQPLPREFEGSKIPVEVSFDRKQ